MDGASAQSPSSPAITLTVGSGPPGTKFTVSGSGFPADEIVAVYIDQPGPYLGQPGALSDARGAFTFVALWPDKGYDSSHRVDPTKAGKHSICADTAYPGSTQPIPAKACAGYIVPGAPATPANASLGWLPLSIIGFAILIALAIGAVLWVRRSAAPQ